MRGLWIMEAIDTRILILVSSFLLCTIIIYIPKFSYLFIWKKGNFQIYIVICKYVMGT